MENRKAIEQKIITIIKYRLKKSFDNTNSSVYYEPLLGRTIGLKPFELAYLVMEVNKAFAVPIPESYLLNPGVRTINDFINAIEQYRKANC